MINTSGPSRDILIRRLFGRLITFSQFAADFLTVFIAYMVSYAFYTTALQRTSPQDLPQFVAFSAAAGILYVLILDRVGLYRREISLLNVKELRGIFHVGLYAAAFILSLSFYFRSIDLSRITLTTAIVSAPILLYLQRQIFYKIHMTFHQRGWSRQRVLIYGASQVGLHLGKRMFESPGLGLLPIGYADDAVERHHQEVRWAGAGARQGLQILGGEEILRRAADYAIDMVFIALPSASFERNQKLVDLCVENRLEYAIVPNAYEEFIQRVEMFEIGGIPVLRRRANEASYVYFAVKRLVDFTLATLLLLVLSPLYLFIGLAIKLETHGPIIFKQKRVGLKGREFSIYKFRSMSLDAPKYAHTPSDPNDPRITRAGRWLRRTSLDELPQIYNVWRGDMSFVGPRPEMPFIVEKYTSLQRQRLEAKPGITGVWQISAVRGEPIHQNIEYDLFYIQNRSILLDLAIIAKTALSVIRGVGAV